MSELLTQAKTRDATASKNPPSSILTKRPSLHTEVTVRVAGGAVHHLPLEVRVQHHAVLGLTIGRLGAGPVGVQSVVIRLSVFPRECPLCLLVIESYPHGLGDVTPKHTLHHLHRLAEGEAGGLTSVA